MTTFGYVRTSTRDQSSALQQDAMTAAGIMKVYTDEGVSGSLASRPELDRLLDRLDDGDEVVVWKLDRIGRNTRNVLELIEQITVKGATFRSLTEGISTTGAMGKAMLTIMSAFAELERSTMLERTHAGLAAAKAKGRTGGRPPALDAKKLARLHKLAASGDHTRVEIAQMLQVSPATVYRVLASS